MASCDLEKKHTCPFPPFGPCRFPSLVASPRLGGLSILRTVTFPTFVRGDMFQSQSTYEVCEKVRTLRCTQHMSCHETERASRAKRRVYNSTCGAADKGPAEDGYCCCYDPNYWSCTTAILATCSKQHNRRFQSASSCQIYLHVRYHNTRKHAVRTRYPCTCSAFPRHL
jgi:hypothetical protein